MPIELLFDDRFEGPLATDRAPQLQDPVAARIGGWWPKGAADTPVERAVVGACRAMVAGGRPADARQATGVLSTVRRFLLWLLDVEPDADLATGAQLLTTERLTQYLEDAAGLAARPKGSADAALSFLRRIGPGGPGLTPAPEGQAETPSTSTGATPERALDQDIVDAATASGPELEGVVADAIRSYVPEALPLDRWNRVATFCRDAVMASTPARASVALAALRSVAYLGVWVDNAQRPVRLDVVFAPDTISAFIGMVCEATGPTSAAAHRLNLVRVGAAVLPAVSYDSLPALPRNKPPGPATDEMVAAAERWARTRRSPKAIRHATALVLLGTGCGLDGPDAAWVTPGDVVDITAGLGVEVRRPDAEGTVRLRRTTFVLPSHAEQLRQAAVDAVEAGDRYLIGGNGIRQRRVETLLRVDEADVDMTRLRYRWMLTILDAGLLPLETFLAAAGLETLRVVDDLLAGRSTPDEALAPLARIEPVS